MATAALILVTAVWGVTFVQVQDAVELYPLFAFLAIRYLVATAALGLVIGLVIGGLGGGGGALTVPALVYLIGLTAQDATTSSVLIVGE